MPRLLLVTAVLVLVVGVALNVPPLAYGYFAGGGKDASKGNDCLIGYDGITSDDVTIDGKKQIVACTDCDPSCDLDGVTTANGSCTIAVGVCINQSGVDGCTPPSALDKASAKGRVKGVKGDAGKVVIDVSQLRTGSACGALLDVLIPVKDSKQGPKDGKASLNLSASVKENGSEGIAARRDKDKLTFLCQPRPEGEACPIPTTTTSSSTSTTIEPSTTSTTLVSTTSTTVASTTSTTVVTTTSTTTTTMPCLQAFEPRLQDMIDLFVGGFDASGNFEVPSSCGGSSEVCCSGGTPITPCGPLHVELMSASVAAPPGTDRFDLTYGMRLTTVADIPVTIPVVGQCFLHFDTSPGPSPTIQVLLSLQLSPGYLEIIQVGDVTINDLTSDDVTLMGGFGCELANLGLDFFIGTLRDSFASVLQSQFQDDLCRFCDSTIAPCP